MYSEPCQTFKIEYFAKQITPECRCATRNLSGKQGGTRFVELDTSDKDFVKTLEKETPQGNILEFFLLDTLKNTF